MRPPRTVVARLSGPQKNAPGQGAEPKIVAAQNCGNWGPLHRLDWSIQVFAHDVRETLAAAHLACAARGVTRPNGHHEPQNYSPWTNAVPVTLTSPERASEGAQPRPAN